MESEQRTPLGFVSGDVEIGAHIMYTYPSRDETFIRNITDFILAGVNAGEMVGCTLDGALLEEIVSCLDKAGVCTDQSDPETMVLLSDVSEIFMRDGLFCTESTTDLGRKMLGIARTRGKKLRILNDLSIVCSSRVNRAKLLEYEALWQVSPLFTIALSAYERSAVMRSFLVEVRRMHSLVATNKGIRHNLSYMEPQRFLSGFYRYRRVTKEYPAVPAADWSVIHDFEEIASRTPLTAVEISSFCTALELLLAHSTGGLEYHGIPAPVLGRQFYVNFNTESDKMIVAVRYHAPGIQNAQPEYQKFIESGRILSEGLADDLRIEFWADLVTVTMVKVYTDPLKERNMTSAPNVG